MIQRPAYYGRILLFLIVWYGLTASVPSCGPVSAAEQSVEPAISHITRTGDNQFLLISFRLDNGYPADAEKVVKSGTPLEVNYDVELLADGTLWDSTIVSLNLTRTLYYDVIKGYFQIGFGTETPRIVSVRHMSEANRFVFEIKNQPVIKLVELDKGTEYKIRVRASVTRKVDLLMPFKPLVSIFSSWGYTTDWNEITFSN